MRLDQLLDNDVLTSAQERTLRRLVKFKIHRVKGGTYLLRWHFRSGDSNIYQIPAKTLMELYSLSYKEVMMSVIEVYTKTVINKVLIKKVKSIIENGIIFSEEPRLIEIDLYNGESMWFPAAKDIKACALFEAFKIVYKAS